MLTTETIKLLAVALERDVDGIPFILSPEQLMAVNILLEEFTSSRQERLALVSKLLGTAVLSTKHLTWGQASAILKVAYPLPCSIREQEIDAEFRDLVSDLNLKKEPQ